MDLSEQALAVLGAIIAYTESNGGRSPSLKDLATALDRKIPTIRHHTQRLEAAGFIRKQRGVRPFVVLKNPDGTPHHYVHRSEPVPGVHVVISDEPARIRYARLHARIAVELGHPEIAEEILRRAEATEG